MIKKLWSAIVRLLHRPPRSISRFTVVMTSQCQNQLPEYLHGSMQQGHEGIVYFLGLTTGTTSLALSGVLPDMVTTPGSVDVSAANIGKVVRLAAELGLQVVGQLHTHPGPGTAIHSQGDLAGMRIRFPGYFSIVVPEYGAHLPGFKCSHTLIWTPDGFQEIDLPIKIFQGVE